MNLFYHSGIISNVLKEFNIINTPLGKILFDVEINRIRLCKNPPSTIHLLPRYGHIVSWNTDLAHSELLITKHTPQLPSHLHIEDCIAAVWRIKCKEESDINFSSLWLSGYDWSEGGPDSGENLDAITWEGKDIRISLGTQDGEKLIARSIKRDMMPIEFGHDIEPYNINHYLDQGLIVPLKSVQPNEICQVHFVLAWSKSLSDDVSTWFAVDELPERLLESAGVK